MSFDADTYEKIRAGCQRSAGAVVPWLYDIFKPDTVVDVGGGEGWWAQAFAMQGCACVVLDESVTESRREVNDHPHVGSVAYEFCDLRAHEAMPPPFDTPGHFDLALCLEVAEHLEPHWAGPLVRDLCRLAPIVIFSAAIPGQGGHGHLNEQWPDYWVREFAKHDYTGTDFIRWHIWDSPQVEPWYRQNMLCFGEVEILSQMLRKVEWHMFPSAVVHPDIYGWRIEERDRLSEVLYPPGGGGDGTVWRGP